MSPAADTSQTVGRMSLAADMSQRVGRPASLTPRDAARRRHVDAGAVTEMARALRREAHLAPVEPLRMACAAAAREGRRIRISARRGPLGSRPAAAVTARALAAPPA